MGSDISRLGEYCKPSPSYRKHNQMERIQTRILFLRTIIQIVPEARSLWQQIQAWSSVLTEQAIDHLDGIGVESTPECWEDRFPLRTLYNWSCLSETVKPVREHIDESSKEDLMDQMPNLQKDWRFQWPYHLLKLAQRIENFAEFCNLDNYDWFHEICLDDSREWKAKNLLTDAMMYQEDLEKPLDPLFSALEDINCRIEIEWGELSWHPTVETRDQAKTRLESIVESELQRIAEECQRQGLEKTSERTQRAQHLEWLVRYRVQKYKYRKIATKYRVTTDQVGREIRKYRKILGITANK